MFMLFKYLQLHIPEHLSYNVLFFVSLQLCYNCKFYTQCKTNKWVYKEVLLVLYSLCLLNCKMKWKSQKTDDDWVQLCLSVYSWQSLGLWWFTIHYTNDWMKGFRLNKGSLAVFVLILTYINMCCCKCLPAGSMTSLGWLCTPSTLKPKL